MFCHEVNFSTACKYPNDVGVLEFLSSVTHILFSTKAFEKAFFLVDLVYKHYLSAINNHAVSSVAVKCENGIMRLALVKPIQTCSSGYTVLHYGLNESYVLLIFESKSPYDLLKLMLVVKDSGQVTIHRNINVGKSFLQFPYRVKSRRTK